MKSNEIRVQDITLDKLTDKFLIGVDSKLKEFYAKYKPSKKDEDELFTVEETTKILKCSKQALWNWRKNDILPSYRLGNRVYYKKSDIFNKLVKQD
jgi:hypothetical protein